MTQVGVHKKEPQSMRHACVLHAALPQEKAIIADVQVTYKILSLVPIILKHKITIINVIRIIIIAK